MEAVQVEEDARRPPEGLLRCRAVKEALVVDDLHLQQTFV